MDKVNEFWSLHPQLDPMGVQECDGEHRCKVCCKITKTEPALKRHYTKGKGGCPFRVKPAKGSSKTKRVVVRMKKVKAQKALDQVQIGNGPNHWPLENVFDFCYLGHHFVADGDSMHAVEVRLAMASTRFGELRHLWKSRDLPKRLKLQLYESGVCSILTHSHEAWKLDEATCRKLRAWNGRNLAVINSGDLPDLNDESFRTLIRLQTNKPDFDLVAALRVRRSRWLGHILRKDESALIRQVVLRFNEIYPEGLPEGSLLMDAPCDNVSELVELAGNHGDHAEWNLIVKALEKRLGVL